MAAGVARGVLEQVREGALELRRVGAHERQVGLDRDVERARRQARGRRSTPRSTSSSEHHSGRGSAASRLQAREIEQVLDEARQPLRLLLDAARELAALTVLDVVGRQRLRRRHDGGDRGAQVVADGPQQRGLDDVAAPQRRASRRRRRAARRAPAPRRATTRAAARPAPARAGARPRAGRRGRSSVPICSASSRSGKATRRSSPSTGRSSIAADGRPSAPARRCAATGEDARQVLAAQQQPRELRGEVGLAAALLGLMGAVARRLRERARDERHDEEDRERDPVLRRRRS